MQLGKPQGGRAWDPGGVWGWPLANHLAAVAPNMAEGPTLCHVSCMMPLSARISMSRWASPSLSTMLPNNTLRPASCRAGVECHWHLRPWSPEREGGCHTGTTAKPTYPEREPIGVLPRQRRDDTVETLSVPGLENQPLTFPSSGADMAGAVSPSQQPPVQLMSRTTQRGSQPLPRPSPVALGSRLTSEPISPVAAAPVREGRPPPRVQSQTLWLWLSPDARVRQVPGRDGLNGLIQEPGHLLGQGTLTC